MRPMLVFLTPVYYILSAREVFMHDWKYATTNFQANVAFRLSMTLLC